MNDILFDSNVLLDIALNDPVWKTWSLRQLRSATSSRRVVINPIIYAELAPGFRTRAELDRWLDSRVYIRRPLPYEAGWIAARAYAAYRRAGGGKTSPLPDFYIGAHAEAEGLILVTRDISRYRTYFPTVTLITP